ncbi:hypothetical protein VHUM_00931 [Vanrija humicola]|uniref:Cytochrome c oxidase assembly factor 6 n=1 Tax=Vanrija humicola TaxID=5417 RepID=A0A7D8V1H4_VANHU|nr:hypothetical protein VHUM_00931 [Vanrija humicola]
MVFGWGSSSTPAAAEPVAPSREQRAKCWSTRDAYFACLDQHGVIQPGDGELGDKQGFCAAFRKEYEGSCGRSWIEYFNKRRVLEIRQQKTLEAAEKQRQQAAGGR